MRQCIFVLQFLSAYRYLYDDDDDLRFCVLLNNISVISGRWANDNERLYAMETRLRLGRYRPERGSNPGLLKQYAGA